MKKNIIKKIGMLITASVMVCAITVGCSGGQGGTKVDKMIKRYVNEDEKVKIASSERVQYVTKMEDDKLDYICIENEIIHEKDFEKAEFFEYIAKMYENHKDLWIKTEVSIAYSGEIEADITKPDEMKETLENLVNEQGNTRMFIKLYATEESCLSFIADVTTTRNEVDAVRKIMQIDGFVEVPRSDGSETEHIWAYAKLKSGTIYLLNIKQDLMFKITVDSLDEL